MARSRALGSLVSVGARLLEVGELEERLRIIRGDRSIPHQRALLKDQLRRLRRIEDQLPSTTCDTCGLELGGPVAVRITESMLGPPEPPCTECGYPIRITVHLFDEPG